VDPVPDPLLLRTLVMPGIEPGISGSVARNSDHRPEKILMIKKYNKR
jgi:hypothetical protein